MKTTEIINAVCAHLGITKAEMAKQMGLYPSSFYRKLSTESMTLEELQRCLDKVGVVMELEFVFPDGDVFNAQTNYEQLYERMNILEQELVTAGKVADFHKKTLKELRTELNSAVGYVELSGQNEARAEEYLKKLQAVHTSMERTISYSLGEAFEEEMTEVDLEQTEALEGQRVLLVEDNELNRKILKEVLLGHGLVVEETDNGGKAISMVKENAPGYYQFILMDIEMPEQDGYETTQKIRKLPNRIRANIPIIALTANANAKNRERATVVGMDDFLVKPVNSVRLLGCLVKYL